MKNKKALFTFLVLIGIFCLGCLFAASKTNSEKELIEELKMQELNDLYDEIDTLDKNGVSETELIYHAAELAEKLKDVATEEYLVDFLSSDRSDLLKVLVLQCCEYIGANINYNHFAYLLNDESIDFEIKREILINIYSSENADVEVIKQTAIGNDKRLAYTALRFLWFKDPTAAINIANDIIKNSDTESDYSIRGALMVKGFEVEMSNSEQTVTEFLSFCDAILKKEDLESQVKESAYFALVSANCLKTLEYVISSEQFTDDRKKHCVTENKEMLTETLESGTFDSDELLIAIHAIRYYPEKDMLDLLLSASETKAELLENSPEVKLALQEVIALNEQAYE